jgi:hypothetical protein
MLCKEKVAVFFWDPYKTHKRNISGMYDFLILKLVVSKVTARL